MELMSNFTEIFTDLFEKANCSKTKFAKALGIDHSQVTLYLNGSIPTVLTMVKICDYFNYSIDYITGLNENFRYENMRKGLNTKCFYPEYQRLLKLNKTNHFRLSKLGIVCETSLSAWKNGGLPQMETIIKIAYELSGSIDKMLGRI